MKNKRRFGQNFLIDHNILEKIISSTDIQSEETILEIGTGKGVLTGALDSKAASVISYEIDHDLYDWNQTKLAPRLQRTELVHGDFLKMPFPANKKMKVIANIPYYITTPIIEKLLENRAQVSMIFLMMQREVADRMVANPGTPDYGSFTIFVNYYCTVKKMFNVSRNCFYPAPKVDSAFVCLIPRPQPRIKVKNEDVFFALVHACFWGRRKTILNAIKHYPGSSQYAEQIGQALQQADISPQIRGERLSIEDFGRLADLIVP